MKLIPLEPTSRSSAGVLLGYALHNVLKWTKGGGKVLPGLVRRRKAEQYLFQTGRLAFEFQ